MMSEYVSHFESLEKSIFSDLPEFVQSLRRSAMERFTELGFPTTRAEDWRDTNIASIARTPFRLPDDKTDRLDDNLLTPHLLGGMNRVVIVNGKFSKDRSALDQLPAEVELKSLAHAIDRSTDELQNHLGQIAHYQEHPFVALNTAFMDDGVFVCLPENQIVETPIHIVYVFSPSQDNTVYHIRNLIRADSHSQATIIEHYVGLGDLRYFANVVTELEAGENSSLNHTRIQQDSMAGQHISMSQIHQQGNSHVSLCSIVAGSRLTRNDLNVVLSGEGAECTMNGLVVALGKQHIDNHTMIDHARSHCTSTELYKGIYAGKSHGVFNGRIIVRKNAQKTDAAQENRNILLSNATAVNSNPQLEIYADDVHCTHASTTGQLDEEALFYLRSRGIDVETALYLMISGFASEIIDTIQEESVRAYIQRTVDTLISAINRRDSV